MDDLSPLRDLGRALEHDPPPSLARQRSRLTDAAHAPRRRRLRPRGWTALALAACAVAALLIVPSVLLRSGGHHGRALSPLGRVDDRPLNVLVLGSDARGADAVHRDSARSDTMALVRLPAGRARVTVVSLPRDLVVQLPACVRPDGRKTRPGPGLINSAYSMGGVSCAIKTVEAVTSVRVDQAVVVNFKGFAHMVDVLGGVTVTLPKSVNDPASGLHLSAGKHKLDGKGALAYARVRHGMGDGSDLDRIKRQQRLMADLYGEALHMLTSNPIRFAQFLKAGADSVKTVPGLDLAGMKALAESFKRTDPSKAHYTTLPYRFSPKDPNRLVVNEPAAARVLAPFKQP
ncbi:LCP family protein [Actinomadura harenae]|uniref:LytR family transcriptional regulator n=1 Tax=Actinomadura harenae TaxID=2483351 RepID=A0A3M2M839_9ACTN|nr:LCP family protein [Actinomadura harenae]RMI45776.1 LytR family transcriptional regulator [Actinomadura harenae]